MIEEISDLNASTRQLITMGCGSRFQSDIAPRKNRFVSLLSLTNRENGRQGAHTYWLSRERLKYVFLLFRIGTFFISYPIHNDNNMNLALPLDQFECVPYTDVELMLMFWRRKCFTGFREDVVYGFRWYLHTLLTWFFHFKSCLIIRPRYLASSNDSSGWTWRVQLNVIVFFISSDRQDVTFVRMKRHYPLPSDIASMARSCWRCLASMVVFNTAMNAMVSSANSRMVELRPTGISSI